MLRRTLNERLKPWPMAWRPEKSAGEGTGCSKAGVALEPTAFKEADLIFRVVSRRDGKKPIVLTTNLPFSEWTTIFPSAECAIAHIDRVIHHASIISIEGDSYRRRVADASRAERKAKKGWIPPLPAGPALPLRFLGPDGSYAAIASTSTTPLRVPGHVEHLR
ncbi:MULTISPECIES: ATP-binding protein [Myxococcus]|nr:MULTISPECIES: ATP-binding protein [Myxococcus]WAM28626.1 ATP-binding protein [Myxococcus sp. NMCA1]